MERDIGFRKAGNLYNYRRCFDWCTENMPHPSLGHTHEGTWGANGEFIWWAYSDGTKDDHQDLPSIDIRYKQYRPFPGSDEKHSFEAKHGSDPIVEGRFVPCLCPACRVKDHKSCWYMHVSGEPEPKNCSHVRTFSVQQTLSRKAEAKEARQARLNARAAEQA